MSSLALLAGGAAGSAIGGYLQGQGQLAAAKANAKTMKELAEIQRLEAQGAYNDVSGMYAPQQAVGTQGMSELQAWQATQAPEQFQYTKDVSDFLDLSMAFQQDQLRQTQEASNAARGGLLSSGAQRQMQDLALKQAQTDFGNSWNRMNADKGNAYSQYIDFFNNSRAVNNDKLSRINSMVGVGQNATGEIANARMGQSRTTQGANQTQYTAQSDYNQVNAASPWNTAGNVMNTLGQGAMGAGMYQMQNPTSIPAQAQATPVGYYTDAQGNTRNGAGMLVRAKQGSV